MILYEKSSKGVIMTYTNPILPSPVLITGAGIDDWLSVDDAEMAILEAGADNTLSAHTKNTIIKGKLMLQPLAPALSSAFIVVMQRQNLMSYTLPGTLTVTLPGQLGIISYNNFILTSPFKGFELATMIKDVPIHWSSEIPNSTIIGDLLSIGEAIAGLI